MQNETASQTVLRRAKEALAAFVEQENTARKALAAAAESTRNAREKYEQLFMEEEKREMERRRREYMHSTK